MSGAAIALERVALIGASSADHSLGLALVSIENIGDILFNNFVYAENWQPIVMRLANSFRLNSSQVRDNNSTVESIIRAERISVLQLLDSLFADN